MTAEPIDPKDLKQIQERFQQLSQKRLQLMLESHNMAQADAIKLLPLLFHVNHPMLPGYVDKDTLCGIPHYSPGQLEKKIAKTVSRSFSYRSRAYLRYEIIGLYLMGSTGTLAQSIRSDLDLWVCLERRPSKKDYDKLQRKTQLISEWMQSKGVELNCYLVYQNQFIDKHQQQGQHGFTNAQNYLLLDEFYRTAVWTCGRMPIWWLVPPEEDYAKYSTRLLKEAHVDASEWLDFGTIPQIPPVEYFSAALWQLYKAIESPYKSTLKLLVLEIYARYFPQSGLLSERFKELVYQGHSDSVHLDPYRLILDYAEGFLIEHPKRLEYLRRAFYLKSGVKIQLKQKKNNNWRYREILTLVEHWGWKQKQLDYLNNRVSWQIDSVIDERGSLVRELTHSYHFITNFARVQGVLDEVSQREFRSLGRMLYAAFEKREFKIDNVNCGIAKDVSEANLTLKQQDDSWHLFLGALRKNQLASRSPVFVTSSFFEALVWSCRNLVALTTTNFHIMSEDKYYTADLAQHLCKDIHKIIHSTQAAAADEAFLNPAEVTRVGIFLNTESDPLKADKDSDIFSVTNLQDGFCWGESKVNLFRQFDVFWSNSWGEYSYRSYSGDAAWVDFFNDFRDTLTTREDDMQVFHYKLPAPLQPGERIFTLLRRWNRLFNENRRKHKGFRFIMTVGTACLRIDFDDQRVKPKVFRHPKNLLVSLDERLMGVIHYQLDDNLALPAAYLKVLSKNPSEDHNCYLMQTGKNRFSIMIVDPTCGVYYQTHRNADLSHLVNQYQQFFDSVAPRAAQSLQELLYLQCWYADLYSETKSMRFRKVKPSELSLADNYLSIRAVATRNADNRIRFDLFAGQQAYLYADFGELIFKQLAKYVTSQRDEDKNYPIFITDMDLSGVMQQAQLMECLNYKRIVEQKLASAQRQLKG